MIPYGHLRLIRPGISQRLSWHNLARSAFRLAAPGYTSVKPWPNHGRTLFGHCLTRLTT